MIRKRFLIKPKLQIKYMAITAFIVLLSGVVVYFALHQVLRSSGGMEQLTPGEWDLMERALDRSLLWIVGFIAAVLAVESIFFFHRMVGPLYVFEKVLRAVKDGDLTQGVHLRQGDEFKEIGAEYNEMVANLSSKINEVKAAAAAISAEKAALPENAKAASSRIDETLKFFKTK